MGVHYVPRRYLKNFEDPGRAGCIWLHVKGDASPKLAAIKAVAQTGQFYSVADEQLLAERVERPGNRAIRMLVESEQISLGERMDMAYYIGTMLMRVPARRHRALGLLPRTRSTTRSSGSDSS